MTFKHKSPVVPITWVVVADRSRARILSSDDSNGDVRTLKEVATLDYPKGAMKESDCVSDHQGRMIGRGGTPYSPEPRTDFEHKTADEFAAQLIDHLEAGRNQHQFGSVILIAPPMFLGVLRQKLSAPLASLVELDIDKDLTHFSLAEISQHLVKVRT